MGLISLYKEIKDIKNMKSEADIVLRDSVANYPELAQEYQRWRKTYRMNTTVCSAFIARQFCKLEGMEFDEEKRKKAYLGSAAACISDDLIDKTTSIDIREVYFLDTINHQTAKREDEQGLFYAFHSGLENLLPDDFKSRSGELIGLYNQAQMWGRKLNWHPNHEEIIEIKNGTGGYPILLFYNIVFPENEDSTRDLIPLYAPQEMKMPETKAGAIFNYGAMMSRADDLADLELDKAEGRKSLATEGLVTLKSLGQDIKYVKDGLKKFYPEKVVDLAMNLCSVRTIRSVSAMTKTMTKILK